MFLKLAFPFPLTLHLQKLEAKPWLLSSILRLTVTLNASPGPPLRRQMATEGRAGWHKGSDMGHSEPLLLYPENRETTSYSITY